MFLMWYRRKIAKEVEEKDALHGFLPERNGNHPKHHCAKGLFTERHSSLQYRLLEHKVSVLLR